MRALYLDRERSKEAWSITENTSSYIVIGFTLNLYGKRDGFCTIKGENRQKPITKQRLHFWLYCMQPDSIVAVRICSIQLSTKSPCLTYGIWRKVSRVTKRQRKFWRPLWILREVRVSVVREASLYLASTRQSVCLLSRFPTPVHWLLGWYPNHRS